MSESNAGWTAPDGRIDVITGFVDSAIDNNASRSDF
jgi:hypothetical protein